jgi:rubrerythrin
MQIENKALAVLKNAILLETRGSIFYRQVAEQAVDESVRRFFSMMADEEEKHRQTLSEQFRAYQENGTFSPANYQEPSRPDVASGILTGQLKEKIAAAGFEAAAISAAMSMEQNAIRLYSERAEAADDPHEKALYQWLAQWEGGHLNFLAAIDKELRDKIWFDNSFWPF